MIDKRKLLGTNCKKFKDVKIDPFLHDISVQNSIRYMYISELLNPMEINHIDQYMVLALAVLMNSHLRAESFNNLHEASIINGGVDWDIVSSNIKIIRNKLEAEKFARDTKSNTVKPKVSAKVLRIKRNESIIKQVKQGSISFAEIGKMNKISGVRVAQIYKKYLRDQLNK